MKILFVELPGFRQPWFDDFCTEMPRGSEVRIYDRARSFAEQVKGVRVVVDQAPGTTSAEMAKAAAHAGVELWQFLATGLDQVNVPEMQAMGLTVANVPGQFSAAALAEHALLLMLCFAKHLTDSSDNVRRGMFYAPLNYELCGSRLGVVGLGASGTALTRIARTLGMRVCGIDAVRVPDRTVNELGLEWAGGPQDLRRLLEDLDYLSLHVPLNERTRNMIGREEFASMPDRAVLINVARGGLVYEKALIEALQAKLIRGAGLDVFVSEPLDPAHPLLHLPNVIATPHIAGMTSGTTKRRARAAAENVARLMCGKELLYTIADGVTEKVR